jgi:hypothetical protein
MKALQTLYINHCPNLQHTDDFSALLAMEELDLSHCVKLTDVQGLTKLTRLKSVNLAGCTALADDAIRELRATIPDATITVLSDASDQTR